jgi:glutaminyl-peptide cyclotransferase
MSRLVLSALVSAAILSCADTGAAPRHQARVVKSFPHDVNAFTQGLEFHNGELWESTGLVGRSGIRKINLESGKVLKELRVSAPFFGEGITIINGRLIQLTWQHQTGFVYQFPEMQLVKQFSYSGEGWGLTNDGKQIYMSDGSAQIRVLDPVTLKEVRRINVRDGGRPVSALNELEWVRGEIYANVWTTDQIVRISPQTGKVLGWLDLSHLPRDRGTADVLNGIAYDATTKRLFVTGKLWSQIYQIELPPPVR